MKNIYVFLFAFIPVTGVLASDLTEYEEHYQELNRLRGQLEKLEIEQKIYNIQSEIDKNIIQNTPPAPSPAAIARERNTFIPSSAKLIYVVGTGRDSKAVIEFNDTKHTVTTGEVLQGWKIRILDKTVEFSKGKNTVKL